MFISIVILFTTSYYLLPQTEVSPCWKTKYEGENIVHSPNGKFIVCVRTKDFIVRDAYSLKQICTVSFIPSDYTVPQFTPDGSKFVLYNNHEVTIVETESGKILYSLKNDIYTVGIIKISRNGKLLAVYDGRINMYEISTGILLFTKDYEELQSPNFIDFSPDDSLLVTQSDFSEVCVLDTKMGDTLYSFYNRFPKKYAILKIINAEYVCYQSDSYDTLNIVEIRTGKFIKSIPVINTVIPPTRTRTRVSVLPLYNYTDSLNTIYSFPDMDTLFQFKRLKGSENTIIYYDDYGNLLYYFDLDTLHCWNIKSRILTAKFYSNKKYCQNNLISINPNGKTAVFDKGTHLMIKDIQKNGTISQIESREEFDALFAPSGDTVYTLGSLFNMRSVHTGGILNEVCSIFPQHSDLFYATDKRVISLNYLQNFVSIYDLKNNVMSDKFHFPISTINSSININGGGRFLMLNFNYNDFARIIDVFDNSTYTVPTYFGHPFYKGKLSYAEFNAQNDKIAMCGEDAYMRPVVLIYDWLEYRTDDKQKVSFLHTTNVSQVRFSKNDKYIVTTCADSAAKIWDIGTKQILANLKHEKSISEARFIHNDSTILTMDGDSTIFVWSVQSQKLLHTIHNKYEISSVEIDHIGNVLLINGFDKKASSIRFTTVWDIRTGKKITQFDSVGKCHINKQGTKILVLKGKSLEMWDIGDIVASVASADVSICNDNILKISPTPTRGCVDVTLPMMLNECAYYEVRNLNGLIAASGVVTSIGNNFFSEDFSELPNGMYFFRIRVERKTLSSKLMIIK